MILIMRLSTVCMYRHTYKVRSIRTYAFQRQVPEEYFSLKWLK